MGRGKVKRREKEEKICLAFAGLRGLWKSEERAERDVWSLRLPPWALRVEERVGRDVQPSRVTVGSVE